MNCCICPKAAVMKCYCTGIMCCIDCFENHKLALAEIPHFSRKIIIDDKPDITLTESSKNTQNKELIISKVEEEIKKLTEVTEKIKLEIVVKIENLQSKLKEVITKIEEKKQETLEKLNSIIKRIDIIDLKEFRKFVKSGQSFTNVAIKLPDIENILDNNLVEVNYHGPNIGPIKLYNIKQEKLRIYDISKQNLEDLTIQGFKSKQFSAIIGFPGSVLVTGGSSILGQPMSTVYEINLKTCEFVSQADLITARYYHSGLLVDSFIYVFGGIGKGEITAIERYGIKSKNWEILGHLHLSRKWPGVCYHRSNIYVAGGNKEFSIEKINLENFHVENIKLEFPLSDLGCSLASTDKGIIIFQSKNICIIGDDDTAGSLVSIEDKNNWWTQSPPVVQDKNIFILRFSDLCVFQFNVLEPSLIEVFKIDINNI